MRESGSVPRHAASSTSATRSEGIMVQSERPRNQALAAPGIMIWVSLTSHSLHNRKLAEWLWEAPMSSIHSYP